MASVTILINWRGYESYELDTRDFDTLPRIGETIMLIQGVDMRKPAYNGVALVRVTSVVHDLRVGYQAPVHAFVEVEPIDDALDVLEHLYPAEEG